MDIKSKKIVLESMSSWIQEGIWTKIKDFVKKIGLGLLPIEPPDFKTLRTTQQYMYLYHGTRPQYVNSIKKSGLLTSHFKKRAKEEGDITLGEKPAIFMSTVINKKSPGFGGLGIPKEIVFILCKVEAKHLSWFGYCYLYLKDVSPRNLTFEDDPKFKKIERENSYLKQK